MTAELNPSDNTNLASSLTYKMVIQKTPEVAYFCNRVNIPGLSLTYSEINNPFTSISIAGDVVNFDTLQVNFIINENMSNWITLFNWMKGLGFPNNFGEFRDLKEEKPSEYSDIVIMIMNNKYNLKLKVTLKRCFPVSLSGVDFDAGETDVVPLVGFASFKYTSYSIEQL